MLTLLLFAACDLKLPDAGDLVTGVCAEHYLDMDDDGWGAPGRVERLCVPRDGWVEEAGDCDDTDASQHPGAVWYADADGDGYGVEEDVWVQCEEPAASAQRTGDCNDHEETAYPGRRETCDNVDNDCDGVVDESGAVGEPTWYVDADGDGWGTTADRACWRQPGFAEVSGDCDDADATTWPGAPETDCDDPVDHNCDGSAGHEDADGDGAEACADCDDGDGGRKPGAAETCDDEDDDCDGAIDEDATDATAWYADADLDGWGVEGDPTWSCDGGPRLATNTRDCDDGDAAVNPGEREDCATADDDDCDGDVNEDDAVGCVSWYPDADGDGWGADEVCTCVITAPTTTRDGDCDDAHATANPDGVEECGTGIDEDCLGSPECGIADALTADDATAVVLGSNRDDEVGWSLTTVDDLDDDGVREMIVGVVGLDGSTSNVGGALVFASPFSGTVDRDDALAVLLGEGSAGFVVAGLGDTDGDGLGDVALGDCWLGYDYGRLYVVGGAALSGDVEIADHGVREGLEVADELGGAVAGVGDVDGDGLADVLAGAVGVGDAGAAYLYAGPVVGSAGASDAVATLEGADAGDQAGKAVAGGDLDGDGLGDLVVSAWAAGDDGAVYVVHGPVSGTVSLAAADAVVRGTEGDDGLGYALAAGDTDGDGLMDLALGAPYADDPTRTGRVHVMTGPFAGESTTDDAAATLAAEPPHYWEGLRLDLVDVDGDGLADLVSGSSFSSSPSMGGLRVYGAPLSGALEGETPAATLGGDTYDQFGKSLTAAGDTDGDGSSDLWVGAVLNDDGGSAAGAAYLFTGGPGH